jgi:DNA mismatch repair protein MutS
MFGEDATEASRILNVALTKRGTTPMCGVPYHAARNYIEKLIGAGWRVAICDQVGEVTAGKLVRREISQVLSPGTLDDFGLDDRKPNFLAALNKRGDSHGLAYCDLSTGEFRLTELDSLSALLDELARVSPSEILIPDHQVESFREVTPQASLDGYVFELEPANELLRSHFKVHSLDGFGCGDLPAGTGAAGALLHYITRQMRRPANHVRQLQPYRRSEFLILDAATQSHLELVQSRAGRGMTLLGALDRTATPMGRASSVNGFCIRFGTPLKLKNARTPSRPCWMMPCFSATCAPASRISGTSNGRRPGLLAPPETPATSPH